MILNRLLNREEKVISQRNYNRYCAVNGVSYMCLGETVMILFAVRLDCPDTVVAVLGAMLFFGFLLLPLGKWMTARVGAARSQADFWVYRNIAALLVAGAAPMAVFGSRTVALAMIVLGAFLFYGFRAAGVVMSQPLVGEFCDPDEQGRFISRSWCYFYSSGLLALITISVILNFSSSVWVLFFIIVAGALFGFTSAGFLRNVRETGQIRESSRQPILDGLRPVLKNRVVIRQLLAGMVCNLGVILTVPISMLALKRGYQVSDTQALLYFLVQLAAAVAATRLLSRSADRFGGRKLTIWGFYGFYLLALFWVVVPDRFFWPLLMIPFIFCTSGNTVASMALAQYFLRSVPKEQQVIASMIISVGTGVVSGLLGMICSSGLLKLSAYWSGAAGTLANYRLYFLLVIVLLPVMSLFGHRLDKESELESL